MDELSHADLKQKIRDLEKELAEQFRKERRLRFQNNIYRVLTATIGQPNAWRRGRMPSPSAGSSSKALTG